MEGLTRGYAARLVKDGITVNAVAPSLIETDMMSGSKAERAARIPLGRLGSAGGSGAGRADGHRQRLHDRPDGAAERRPDLQLKRRLAPSVCQSLLAVWRALFVIPEGIQRSHNPGVGEEIGSDVGR